MNKIIALILPMMLSLSCQKPQNANSENIVPESIASAQEQSEIKNTVSEIQELGDRLRLNRDFNSFPIRIVEKYSGDGGALAFCQQREDGTGVYIGILKSTMDNYFAQLQPKGENSFLYLLIVHEFGHCLYGRDHEDATISVPGLNIFFAGKNPAEYVEIGGEIPVSVMMTQASSSLGSYVLPEDVKSYYLSEIAGLKRWKNREDLEAVNGVKLIHP